MDSNTKIYDFVIIGSGMGGLLSSVLLAMKGFSVLVLEKNHQIGGSLQVFSRDKCVFDTGVHYIGSLDAGENLNQIFRYVGILDKIKMKRLDDDCFDLIRFPDGTEIKHGQGYRNFKKHLKLSFPEEERAIDLFCDKIQEICDYFPLYNLEEDSAETYTKNPDILEISAWKYLESITENERLKNVLVGSGPLYAGDVDSTPLYVVALIMNSYLKGSYRMIDGGSQIAKLLTKRLHELGGDIFKHQEVCGAEFEGKNIVSVRTKCGDVFRGKNFISNVHPKLTVDIFGKDNFRPAYRRRIQRIENTISSFMLYLTFHENSFPYMNYNIYVYSKDNVWKTVEYNEQEWPEVMFVCTSATRNQGIYAESMSVMAYMDYKEVAEWSETFNTIAQKGERGNEYELFKRKKEEQMIDELEKTFPNIRQSIKSVYSSTPLTYKNYIGTEDGALYGIKKDYNDIMFSKINAKTRIPNLYQTGQNLVFHGILGASIGALVTCFNFVDGKQLIDEIKNA